MSVWGVFGRGSRVELDRLNSAWTDLLRQSAIDPIDTIEEVRLPDLCVAWTGDETEGRPERCLVANGELLGLDDVDNKELINSITTQAIDDGLDIGDGLFTLITWDPEGKWLEMISDNAAIRSLYYICSEKKLWFSSNPAHLARAKGCELDAQACLYFLQTGQPPVTKGLFKDISRLLPSHRLRVEFVNSGSLRVRSATYIGAESFDKTLTHGEAVEMIDKWLNDRMDRIVNSVSGPVVDLTQGVDSRLLSAYASRVTASQVHFVTSLGEYPKAHKIFKHLPNRGDHVDLDQAELGISTDDIDDKIDSFLLAGGQRELRQALEARLRIESIFGAYQYRICGCGGEIIRDTVWFQDIPKIVLGLPLDIDTYLRRSIAFLQLPSSLWRGDYQKKRDVVRLELNKLLSYYPHIKGTDLIDFVFTSITTRGKFAGALNQSDMSQPYRLFSPYLYHKLLSVSRHIQVRSRMFSRIARDLLYSNRPELCSFPTDHKYTLRPLRGLWLPVEMVSMIVYYLNKFKNRIFRIFKELFVGSRLIGNSVTAGSALSQSIDPLIIKDLSGSIDPQMDELINFNEVRRIVKSWSKGVAPLPVYRLALDRIATMNRLAKFVNRTN